MLSVTVKHYRTAILIQISERKVNFKHLPPKVQKQATGTPYSPGTPGKDEKHFLRMRRKQTD